LNDRQRGRTILLSSHILAEVEAVCDRVTIIRKGRVVESGTLAELRHLTHTSITAELTSPPVKLAEMSGVFGFKIEGNRVQCEVETGKLNYILRYLTSVGIRSLTSQPPSLEELFLRHYQDQDERAETRRHGDTERP
jgi:ABC-2 type transport system ATP-binding protein